MRLPPKHKIKKFCAPKNMILLVKKPFFIKYGGKTYFCPLPIMDGATEPKTSTIINLNMFFRASLILIGSLLVISPIFNEKVQLNKFMV